MGSLDNLDKVKAEKANAMRRYNMKRNLTHFLRLSLSLLLLYVSFSYYAVVLETVRTKLSFLNNHLFVFLFLNFIVFLVVYMSNSNSSNSNTGSHDNHINDTVRFNYRPDFYDEYVAISNAPFGRKTIAGETEEITGYEKKHTMQLAVVPEPEELAVSAQQPVLEVAEDPMTVGGPMVVVPAATENNEWKSFCNNNNTNKNDSNNTSNNKVYRRTRSELLSRASELKTMIGSDGGAVREMRRSETTERRRREVVVGGGGGKSDTVQSMEEMNSEEFRSTIDKFIANKRKLLRDENVALLLDEA